LPRQIVVPGMGEVATRWLLPESSPWAPYNRMTLLAALGSTARVAPLPRVQELAARRAAEMVARAGLPDATMWVIDLHGAASVVFGATLSQRSARPVAPVLTFNDWPAKNELVPAEEALAALVTMEPKRLAEGEPGAPVFLLDSWRLANKDEWPEDLVTDNRYMLTPSDLPIPSVLSALGIAHVLYVVENLGVTTTEEDDLHEAFAAYQGARITISMVDLGWLFDEAFQDPARWHHALFHHILRIEPRITPREDLQFYRRPRGARGYAGPASRSVMKRTRCRP
jgi:hypothetical protein